MSTPARVAVVTGAASGIGRAVARRLSQDGLAVVCIDIDGGGAETTARRIEQGGGRAQACHADVSSSRGCVAAAAVASQLGGVSVLCNIAGISPFASGIRSVDEELWDRVLAVNVKSVYLMSRACLDQLADKDGAVICNTASVHAFAAMPESAPYAASKGAIVALTRQMAVDLASSGIRVVAVAPGSVDTPATRSAAHTMGTTLASLGFVPDRRRLGWLGQPEDVAEVFAFLISPSARFMNGTTVVVDGGLLAPLAVGSNRWSDE